MGKFKVGLALLCLLIAVNVAAQDYTSRYFHYDQYYDAPDPFSIKATTVDGNDFRSFLLTGGGAAGSTRGAYIGLYGNENASHGKLLLGAGNDAGDGGIYFATGGLQHFNIPLSITPAATLAFGTSADSTPGFTIRSNKVDGSDDALVDITAGGAWDTSRGAGIELLGNDYGGAGAGAGITYEAGTGTLGLHNFKTAGLLRWFITAGGNLKSEETNGGSLYFMKPSSSIIFGNGVDQQESYNIQGNSADSKDKTTLQIMTSGSAAATRGAAIKLFGNEVTTTGGAMTLSTGDAATGHLAFRIGGYDTWSMPHIAAATSSDLVAGISTVASSVATIRMPYADGADTGTLNLTAGGAAINDGTRGGTIQLTGEDVGGLDASGKVIISAGVGGSSDISFLQKNYTRWVMLANASASVADLGYGANGYGLVVATIRARTADGGDDATLQLTGGGSSTLAGARGAYISLQGEDVGGADKGGNINIVGGVGNASSAGNFPSVTIRNDSTDAADYGKAYLCGGGACASSRGSWVYTGGNESGAGGALSLSAGDSGGDPTIYLTASAGSIYATSAGNFNFQPGGTSNGAALGMSAAYSEVTLAAGTGAAGVDSVTNICGSGIILGVSARVTQAPGGGATTFSLGCAGSGNLDQFVQTSSTALATTAVYPTNGDGTNTPWVQKTAGKMTVTTDANVTGASMKVRIAVYRIAAGAPSS